MIEEQLEFDFMKKDVKAKCEHKYVKYNGINMLDEIEFAIYVATCKDCKSTMAYHKNNDSIIYDGLDKFTNDYNMFGSLPKKNEELSESMYIYQQKLLEDMTQ